MGLVPLPDFAGKELVDEKKLIEMDQRLAEPELSLNAPHGDSEKGLEAFIPVSTKGAQEEIEEKELKVLLNEKIEQYKKTLKPRDREILEKRILSESPETLQSLGDRFHITKERVRQLESSLSKRLESYLKKEFRTFDEKTENLN